MFFTQQDVDALKRKYGKELDDYLMSGQMMDAAQAMHSFTASAHAAHLLCAGFAEKGRLHL
ncbi:MAG: hypothetical protein ACLT38_07945 [Akkermansia sp.]